MNAIDRINVHSIAIQVPISDVRRPESTSRTPRTRARRSASTRRPAVARCTIIKDSPAGDIEAGPFVQVSRLGNPLFNEVIVPMERKDQWNKEAPADDKNFAEFVAHPGAREPVPGALPGRVPEPRGAERREQRRAPTCSRSC